MNVCVEGTTCKASVHRGSASLEIRAWCLGKRTNGDRPPPFRRFVGHSSGPPNVDGLPEPKKAVSG